MIPILIVGFCMVTLGIALLLVGATPILPGKRIPALRSRIIGVLLVLFLPLSLGAVLLCDTIFGRGAVDGPIVTWVLFAFCWITIAVMLFRVVVPKKERGAMKPETSSERKNPFAAPAEPLTVEVLNDEPIVVVEKPAPKNVTPKKVVKPSEKDPFDFS